ncbi:MAG: 23S rRNA (guanosine(2251)-2'-O)-methyltransferase RlmB [Actinobacteria bacterium]|nr:23S rRNA (guanosine(2251)-2'-O)-methyltransferase RlmB [Actinomycetota bacterium]
MRELLIAGRRRVHEVLMAEDLDPAPILREIVELAEEARVPVRQLSRSRLEAQARTDAPQGVLATAAPLDEADLDELAGPLAPFAPFAPVPYLLALDGVTDPRNVGALLRTAACAGVTGVVLPRHRAAHVTPAVTKAAAGAVEHLPIAVVGGLPAALARLRERGVWVVGLDAGADTALWELQVDATEPVCVVLGAEDRGLARLTRERCDEVAAIPMRGRLESLNVAVAGGLALFEIARRRA